MHFEIELRRKFSNEKHLVIKKILEIIFNK
jgi:hypothetical protein